jgi:WD40 repeat protein
VKLWTIPKEGLTQDLKNDSQTYLGHKRKVCLVDFNHHAADVVASAAVDSTVQVWNMIKAENYATCKISGNPTSLEWNYDGSLIGATDSERNITIFDPRSNNIVLTQKAVRVRPTNQ